MNRSDKLAISTNAKVIMFVFQIELHNLLPHALFFRFTADHVYGMDPVLSDHEAYRDTQVVLLSFVYSLFAAALKYISILRENI